MTSWGDKRAPGLCEQPDDQLGEWLEKRITSPSEGQGHLRLPEPKLTWEQGPGDVSCGGGGGAAPGSWSTLVRTLGKPHGSAL